MSLILPLRNTYEQFFWPIFCLQINNKSWICRRCASTIQRRKRPVYQPRDRESPRMVARMVSRWADLLRHRHHRRGQWSPCQLKVELLRPRHRRRRVTWAGPCHTYPALRDRWVTRTVSPPRRRWPNTGWTQPMNMNSERYPTLRNPMPARLIIHFIRDV
jgi:hypothetical protein